MFTKWKIIGALFALVAVATPGVLGYRYVKGVIEDNKTLTTDRDKWKRNAVYWYQQNQATLKRLEDQQKTTTLLAANRSSATATGRRVTDAFKQTPQSTAADASRAANDAFSMLACASGGTCRSSAATPARGNPRPGANPR